MVSRAEPRKQKTLRPERTGIAGAVSPRKRRKKKREECPKSGRMSEERNEPGQAGAQSIFAAGRRPSNLEDERV